MSNKTAKEDCKSGQKDTDKIKKAEHFLEKICGYCRRSQRPGTEKQKCPTTPSSSEKRRSSVGKKTPCTPPQPSQNRSLSKHGTVKSNVSTPVKPIKSGTPSPKCAAEGVMTRNPFLNYLRYFRKTHCGMSMKQIAIEGGKSWNEMPDQEKWPYIVEAYRARKRRHSSSQISIRKRKRRNSRASKRRRSCGGNTSYIN